MFFYYSYGFGFGSKINKMRALGASHKKTSAILGTVSYQQLYLITKYVCGVGKGAEKVERPRRSATATDASRSSVRGMGKFRLRPVTQERNELYSISCNNLLDYCFFFAFSLFFIHPFSAALCVNRCDWEGKCYFPHSPSEEFASPLALQQRFRVSIFQGTSKKTHTQRYGFML